MWEKQAKIVGLFALVGLGIWLCASVVGAAGRDDGKALIAVVDTGVVSDKATPFVTEREAFQKQADDLDTEIRARFFLTADETQQLDALVAKTKRTPEEDKKMKTIIEDGLKREREIKDLQGKSNKTQQELARLRELESTARRNSPEVRELTQQYQERLQKENLDARKRLADKVKEAAGQVGSKKGYAMVVPKDVALWSNPSIDVTSDVMSYLNGKK
jgi:Skp family chaperone for outer membrane proteins